MSCLSPSSFIDTFRRGNIPGYTGQVHWSRFLPSHSNMPTPEPTTSARIHRYVIELYTLEKGLAHECYYS